MTISNTVDKWMKSIKEATRKLQQRESRKKAEDDRTAQERQRFEVQRVASGSMETDENDDETTEEISSLRRPEYNNSDSDFQMEPSRLPRVQVLLLLTIMGVAKGGKGGPLPP